MRTCCCLLGTLFHLLACGPLEPDLSARDYPITGGESSQAFAATGAIVLGDHHICTATLVAPDMLICAAHCFHNASPAQVTQAEFVLGLDASQSSVRAHLERVLSHPDFDYHQDYRQWQDVAVVWLQWPIHGVRPAVLHDGPAADLVGRELHLVGFGRSMDESMDQMGEHRRMARVTCAGATETKLIYSFQGSGACHGDSGGPAWALFDGGFRQVGITSGGSNSCAQDGYYTRIDVYADWLREQGVPIRERQRHCGPENGCDGACLDDWDCENLGLPAEPAWKSAYRLD